MTDKKGMVDVGGKRLTRRMARASAQVVLGQKIFACFKTEGSPKGDVLAAARMAGVLAAKSTPQWIPFCHPLLLDKIDIGFDIDPKAYKITVVSEVACRGRTGVEMEALSAVSVAALTIYDMMKWAGKGITICDVQLLKKTGGKSGDYQSRRVVTKSQGLRKA